MCSVMPRSLFEDKVQQTSLYVNCRRSEVFVKKNQRLKTSYSKVHVNSERTTLVSEASIEQPNITRCIYSCSKLEIRRKF